MSRATPFLVFDADTDAAVANVLAFEEAVQRSRSRGGLCAEATAIEAWHGNNPYSDFLKKHGCRPGPEEASAIGRLIGARVKAADGHMYPARTTTERMALRTVRQEAANETQRALEIHRLRKAISGLAANTSDPAEVIRGLCPDTEEPEIREQLQDAIEWLTRFAEEWQRRETGRTD
jgi:uncharacterized membrane protein